MKLIKIICAGILVSSSYLGIAGENNQKNSFLFERNTANNGSVSTRVIELYRSNILLIDGFENPIHEPQDLGLLRVTQVSNDGSVGSKVALIEFLVPDNPYCLKRDLLLLEDGNLHSNIAQLIFVKDKSKMQEWLISAIDEVAGTDREWQEMNCSLDGAFMAEGFIFSSEHPRQQLLAYQTVTDLVEAGPNKWWLEIKEQLPTEDDEVTHISGRKYQYNFSNWHRSIVRLESDYFSEFNTLLLDIPMILNVPEHSDNGTDPGTDPGTGTNFSNEGSQFNGGAQTFDERYRSPNTVHSIAFIDLSELSLEWLERYADYLIANSIPVMIIDGLQSDAEILNDQYEGLQSGPAPQPEANLQALMDQYGIHHYPAVLQGGWVWQEQ